MPQQVQKNPRSIACAQCRRRKVKCDHNTPCSNCLKANVDCLPYTAPASQKRRPCRKDIEERLSRCEALVIEHQSQSSPSDNGVNPTKLSISPSSTGGKATDSSPLAISDPLIMGSIDQPTRRGNDDVHFTSGHFQANVHPEAQATSLIIDEDDDQRSKPMDHGRLPSLDNMKPCIEAGNLSCTDTQYPKPVHIFIMWQVFLDRVNPLTKIIHVPTMQSYVVKATTDPNDVPLSYQALLFGIYLMAAISLNEEECQQKLEDSRRVLLKRFTTQMRHSLAQFGFAMDHDMASLQACILFQLSLQEQCGRQEAKALSEVILNVATGMNYHRDGDILNLPPFETEMRRRIWWHIVSQDNCLDMASGLGYGSSRGLFDTKPPRNLNDVDLFPHSTKPAIPRDGPTEMAFTLIRNRLAEFAMFENERKTGFGRGVLRQEDDTGDDSYRKRLVQFERDVKELEQRYISPSAGAAHDAASVLCTMIKHNFLNVPFLKKKHTGEHAHSTEVPDDVLEAVVKDNEERTEVHVQLAKHGFAWLARHTFRIDIFADLVGQLRRWPAGHVCDRGWVVVEKTYRWQTELFDMERYLTQGHLTLEAFEAREGALEACGCIAETPWFISRLRRAFSTYWV